MGLMNGNGGLEINIGEKAIKTNIELTIADQSIVAIDQRCDY